MPRAFKTSVYVITTDKAAIPPFTYCQRIPGIKKKRKKKENYKKGFEIRISLKDKAESNIMRAILRKLEINTGNAYSKFKRIILPIYGENNVKAFIAAVSRTETR